MSNTKDSKKERRIQDQTQKYLFQVIISTPEKNRRVKELNIVQPKYLFYDIMFYLFLVTQIVFSHLD